MKKPQKSKNKPMAKKDIFLHLIYEYRCLATAGYAWKRFGDPISNDTGKDVANGLIPEIGTLIQDSLLLHTRTLIEFYWSSQPRPTDLSINQFVTLSDRSYTELIKLKKPIEVHVLHLTSWRDTQHRTQSNKTDVQRPDWNKVNGEIFSYLDQALKESSNTLPNPWQTAFRKLSEAAKSRFTNGSNFEWPSELGEKKDVIGYLQKL